SRDVFEAWALYALGRQGFQLLKRCAIRSKAIKSLGDHLSRTQRERPDRAWPESAQNQSHHRSAARRRPIALPRSVQLQLGARGQIAPASGPYTESDENL